MIQENTLTREERAARGSEAKRLLEHPLLKEAFANLRAQYFEAWSNTPPDKVDERDGIYHANRVLGDVMTHLRIVMDNGQVEDAHIQRMAQRKQR